jgi:ferritin-like metal-binding protein YciE
MDELNKERLVRYLNDAWSVENALVSSLTKQAQKSEDPELEMMYSQHARMTETQRDRIAARLADLGEKPSNGKGLFTTLMATFADMMHRPHDEFDEQAQVLMKSYAIEHLECAMYRSLEAYAEAIGDARTANLARELMAEEDATAKKLWPQIGIVARIPARA